MKERVYRSRSRKVFGGVAAGLAEYFNLDPVLVRVIFILITIFNGVGIILYIILWIIIPEEPIDRIFNMPPSGEKPGVSEQEKNIPDFSAAENFNFKRKTGNTSTVAGIILVVIGLIFLFDNILPYFDFEDFIPMLLIGVGIILIWQSIKK